jgi:valyl-tRNA synthetase
VTKALDGYNFGNAAETIWRFIWYEFCDWYVEATKVPENHATRAAILSFVWNNGMRLLHPMEPFISEEVWLALPHDGETIMTAAWPDSLEVPVEREAESLYAEVRQVAEQLRNQKAEAGIPVTQKVRARVPAALKGTQELSFTMAAAGCVADFVTTQRDSKEGQRLLQQIFVEQPLDERVKRYRKEIGRLRAEVDRLERKLANGDFVAKAAADVVAKERTKLDGYRAELARVEVALAASRTSEER